MQRKRKRKKRRPAIDVRLLPDRGAVGVRPHLEVATVTVRPHLEVVTVTLLLLHEAATALVATTIRPRGDTTPLAETADLPLLAEEDPLLHPEVPGIETPVGLLRLLEAAAPIDRRLPLVITLLPRSLSESILKS